MSKIEKAIELAARVASEYYDLKVTPESIRSPKRTRHHVVPRQVCMYFIRSQFGDKITHIAKCFNRDHTSVLHSLQVVSDMIMTNNMSYCEIYEGMLRNVDWIDSGVSNLYLVEFPKYGDHDKLKRDLLNFYNIKTISNERTFYDSPAPQPVLSDEC